MASAADLTELNEKECSVCHELFTEPKLLACGHLLCRHCLISWLKSLPEAQCPLCRCPILEAKDRGGKNLEDIADSFPTDLAMNMIVDAERVLNKGHSCCVCEDVAATSMCLTCGDMLCETCTKAHRKMSSSRHHTVEDLSSLTPEKMAAERPERCALHADKASRFYCRKHDAAICSLCATTDHRSCPEVTKLETKMEEARATLKKLVSTLTTGETELKSAIRQLDQHLQETEKRTQEAIAETDAVCDRLESAVKECRRRVREQAQSACSDVREAVQGGKACLLNRQGKMATHKRVAQRVQEMKTCADLQSMTSVMRTRVMKDLDRGSALPPDAKVINTVSLVVDPQVVSCIEKGLSELGLVKTAPANLLQQSLAEMFKPAEGSWECPGCYVNNNADVQRCLACQKVKPGAKPEEVKSPPKEDPFTPAAPAGGFGGFKFGGGAGGREKGVPGDGGGGGFKFGGGAGGREKSVPGGGGGGFKFGGGTGRAEKSAPGDDGGGFKFGGPAPGQGAGEKKSLAVMFKPAEGSWECPGCYVNNNADVLRCLACQTVKPGAKPEEVKSPPKEDPFTPAAPAGGFGGFKFGGGAGGREKGVPGDGGGGGFKFGGGAGGREKSVPGGGGGGFKFGGGTGRAEKSAPGDDGGGFKFGAPAPGQGDGEKKENSKAVLAFGAGFKSGPTTGTAEVDGFHTGLPPSGFQFHFPPSGFKLGVAQSDSKRLDAPPSGFKLGGVTQSDSKRLDAPPSGFKLDYPPGGFKLGVAQSDSKRLDAPPSGFKLGGVTQSDSKRLDAPPSGFKLGGVTQSDSKRLDAPPSGFKLDYPPGGFKLEVTQSDSKRLDAPPSGFKLGGVTQSDSKRLDASPGGFKLDFPQKAESSSTLAGLKFSFGTPTTKASTVSPGFFLCGSTPATSAARPSGFGASAKDSVAKDSGSPSGKPQATAASAERKPESSSALTSDDPPETTQRSIFGAASLGGAFVSTADCSKPSGFQEDICLEPLVPLPEKIEVKTGEKDEDVLFESRARLFRFVGEEWKERGLGVLKILQHRESGRIRLLMRREQVLKICCNHYITGDLDLKPMPRSEGKAWIWYAMDFTEGDGNMEQLAVRFRDADVANNFKEVFDDSKEKLKTPSKVEAAMSDPSKADVITRSSADVSRRLFEQEDDDDVEFLYEEKPTAEQVERARKLLLPDAFYLYENRPGCPGCIGCEDCDPSKPLPVAAAAAPRGPEKAATASTAEAAEQPQKQPVQEEMFQKENGGGQKVQGNI